MNKRGQALVEFIIILPILVFIMLVIIDYGTLSYSRNKLENVMTDVAVMYKNNESNEEINNFITKNDTNITLDITNKDKYLTIKLSKPYDYITPGLSSIFKTKNIVVERTIYNEQ